VIVADLDVWALLTATQAAGYARVKVTTICKWRERGHIPIATDPEGNELRDPNGRPLYRLLDVAKADARTRERAAVMAERLAARANAA
jgi:hypothetical protein